MDRLLNDYSELRRRHDRLKELRKARGLTARSLEALAECSFRLGVHPKTSPQEALDLLRKAAVLEPGNPKHPYHIARLYFIHGEFDSAAEWLRVAAVRCPTSHRVWAHVALLHRELYARYKVNDAYDGDALLRLGADITGRIKEGKDEFGAGLLRFVPPPSKKTIDASSRDGYAPPRPAVETEPFPEGVGRLTDPGKCRWGGVVDLEMEREFQEGANGAGLQALLPSLEAAARAAAVRRDRLSAFVVLAIQWILTGYPPGSIRRLCPVPLPPDPTTPELELLALVVRAFEAPQEQVPVFLAVALDEGRIPPTLAAVIHHRRLLAWRPLAFEMAAKVGAIRRFSETTRGGDPEAPGGDKLDSAVRKHRATLSAARKVLRVAPKKPLEDAVPTRATVAPLDGASAREQLGRLRKDAATLKEVKNRLVTHILERVESPLKAASAQAACASAAGDRPAVERIRDEVKQTGAIGQTKLDRPEEAGVRPARRGTRPGLRGRTAPCARRTSATLGTSGTSPECSSGSPPQERRPATGSGSRPVRSPRSARRCLPRSPVYSRRARRPKICAPGRSKIPWRRRAGPSGPSPSPHGRKGSGPR